MKSPLPLPPTARAGCSGVQGRVCPPRLHAADHRTGEKQQLLVPSLLGFLLETQRWEVSGFVLLPQDQFTTKTTKQKQALLKPRAVESQPDPSLNSCPFCA